MPMMMEFILIVLGVVALTQNSSLWVSVLLIPFSISLMVMSNSFYHSGGLTAWVFIMVFVGGLLILLVLVTSTAPQEEASMMSSLLVVVLFLLIILEKSKMSIVEYTMMSEETLSYVHNKNYIFMLIVLIMMALSVISIFFLKFKGLMRSL